MCTGVPLAAPDVDELAVVVAVEEPGTPEVGDVAVLCADGCPADVDVHPPSSIARATPAQVRSPEAALRRSVQCACL
jgi:hypothetical protein